MPETVNPTQVEAFAELNDEGTRIHLHFQYDKAAVLAAKAINGNKFVPKDKGGPLWQYPLDTTVARRLREMFPNMKLGDGLKKWGKEAVAQERNLRSISGSMDGTLEVLPKKNKKFDKFLRGYQKADARFIAMQNALVANQPGTGKTVEVIAAILESEHDDGPQLVVAPKTSLESVWLAELDRWLPEDVPVFVVHGEMPKDERLETVAEFTACAEAGEACWLVTNPAMIRFVDNPDYVEEKYLTDDQIKKLKKKGVNYTDERIAAFPELYDIHYNWFVVDEYHKTGLTNPKTAMYEAVNAITADRKALMSGTPMGGKPVKLWGALHFLHPDTFTSRWRWVDQWLDVEEDRFGKKVKGVQAARMDEFYEHLAPYMVRRTKAEVAPQLPAKNRIDLWYEMTTKQKKQYDAMAAAAEVKIEEESLTATGILAEYTRLKQFADAHQTVRTTGKGELIVKPTFDSGMLPMLMENVIEPLGITPQGEDDEGDEQLVIGSQFSSVIDMVHEWLTTKQGIDAVKITGAVTAKRRKEIVEQFQGEGGPRVLLITTTAGGVSITLDKASTVAILDETWDPDDQEQLEDRVHRISRIHQVTIYYLRAKGTIEEYIKSVTDGKMDTNIDILDARRQGLTATGIAEEVAA